MGEECNKQQNRLTDNSKSIKFNYGGFFWYSYQNQVHEQKPVEWLVVMYQNERTKIGTLVCGV
jgi:hypothetical protein